MKIWLVVDRKKSGALTIRGSECWTDREDAMHEYSEGTPNSLTVETSVIEFIDNVTTCSKQVKR